MYHEGIFCVEYVTRVRGVEGVRVRSVRVMNRVRDMRPIRPEVHDKGMELFDDMTSIDCDRTYMTRRRR